MSFSMSPQELKHALLQAKDIPVHEADSFLNPIYNLADPMLFTDMERAVTRIKEAVSKKEHIGIYADYDCDGIPGAVILVDFFKKIGYREYVHVYIPDRHDEGYGVSIKGITELRKSNVTLIITVDVGITALAETLEARKLGIDLVITDHHKELAELPNAYAVIHPCKSTYPNVEPCGAVVAFHLVRGYLALYGKENAIVEGWEKWLLDLAGFATLSDMVPLVGENRTIALYGLMVMRKTKRIGLQTLFAKNKLYAPFLTEQDLTFTVAPRLNAASRMDTPMLAFELLATESLSRATAIVDRLDEINAERKLLVARIVKEADKGLSQRELPPIVVIGNSSWRPAVLGLVATKLQEKHERSFFVWGQGGDGGLKGSCRMMSEHHAALLFQALPEGVLLHAGGHQAAGGFAVSKEQVHFLEEALNNATKEVLHSIEERTTPFSIPLALCDITTKHLAVVRMFAPFGVGNKEPLFLFEDVTVQSVKMFGKQKEHIECVIGDATGTATAFSFFADDACVQCIRPGQCVTILGMLEAGFRGGVRIRMKEMRSSATL